MASPVAVNAKLVLRYLLITHCSGDKRTTNNWRIAHAVIVTVRDVPSAMLPPMPDIVTLSLNDWRHDG